MNQYQNRNAEEQKTFLSKIRDNYSSKFANLSLSSTIQKASSYVDKDGHTEDDTLIHNAFVKYFDNKGQVYPEWLGVKKAAPQQQSQSYSHSQQAYGSRYGSTNSYQNSQFKPVYTDYNSNNNQQEQFDPRYLQSRSGYNESPQLSPPLGGSPQQLSGSSGYKPRSSSRLQDMYNKSRQQHVPGGGYNTQRAPGPNRTNSSTSGSRLRERMMNSSPSMTGLSNAANGTNSTDSSSSSRSTWGSRRTP